VLGWTQVLLYLRGCFCKCKWLILALLQSKETELCTVTYMPQYWEQLTVMANLPNKLTFRLLIHICLSEFNIIHTRIGQDVVTTGKVE
jgi:hypothetical protein